MFSAMMFALKQIGDHSLQAKKSAFVICKRSAFLHFIVYLIIFQEFSVYTKENLKF